MQDSIKSIGMRNPFIHTQSFNRANLRYEVRKKDAQVMKQIAEIIRSRRNETGIIYCLSKKGCEEVSASLQKEIPEMRRSITFYHADVRPEIKEERQRGWSRGDIKVCYNLIMYLQ